MNILVRQFKSPLIWILLIAAVITGFFLRELVDTAVILLTVVVNTLLGFWQEYRADKALQAISKLLVTKVKVIRGGKRLEIEQTELVVGDIVILEIGNIAPADGRLMEGDSVSMNEAILTGESMPVVKQATDHQLPARNASYSEAGGPTTVSDTASASAVDSNQESAVIFAGTSVSSGIGRMKVEKLGGDTRMGQIAHTLKKTTESLTPLQKQVAGLAKLISFTVLFLAVAIFILGAAQGKSIPLIFKLVVAMLVGSIPEGLAINLTVLLALGMKRISKFKILVKNLIAAETLGNVTALCLDKTGTLTEGKMRVTGSDFTDEKLGIIATAACNDRRDPLEIAMYDWVKNADEIFKEYARSDEIPFSPVYKYIATLHPAKEIIFVSGAPEVLLERSDLSDSDKKKWKEKFDKYASDGSRLVAFGYKSYNNYKDYKLQDSDISDLAWLGIIIFEDPIRESAAAALVYAQKIGLKLHVITGDHAATTAAVVAKLKIKNEKLKTDSIRIYARVSPEEKLDIVKKLQHQGEVVAMTGDGVNDALALKKADVGIVMGESSDVARETADLILLTNDFGGIAEAIREGRSILSAFRNIISYLLSHSLAEVVLVSGGIFLPIPLPILATQILWTNMISDSLPGLALALERPDQKIRPAIKKLFTGEVIGIILTASLLVGPLALGGFIYSWKAGGDVEMARSLAFAMLGAGSLLYALFLGSRKNIWLWIAVAAGILMVFAPVYMKWGQVLLELKPLPPAAAAATVLAGGFIMLAVGAVKKLAGRAGLNTK